MSSIKLDSVNRSKLTLISETKHTSLTEQKCFELKNSIHKGWNTQYGYDNTRLAKR